MSAMQGKELVALPEGLSPDEEEAYVSWQQRNRPAVAASTQSKFFELFLHGHSCAEIQQMNPSFELGAIVAARVVGQWDDKRDAYLAGLLARGAERVQQVRLESIYFISNMLAATNKLHGEKFKRYLQNGDPQELDGITIRSFKEYKEVVDVLLKLTGQDVKKVAVDAHVTGAISAPVGGATPLPTAGSIKPEQAAEILRLLEESEEKK